MRVKKTLLLSLFCCTVLYKISYSQNLKQYIAFSLTGQLTIPDRPRSYDKTVYSFNNRTSPGFAISYSELDKTLNREFQIGVCWNRPLVVYDYTYDVYRYIEDRFLYFSTVSVKGGLNFKVAKKWTTGLSLGIGYRTNTAIGSQYDFSAVKAPSSSDTIGIKLSAFDFSEPYWVALSTFKVNYLPSRSRKIILSLAYEYTFLYTFIEPQELNVHWIENSKTLKHELSYIPTFSSIQLSIVYLPFIK